MNKIGLLVGLILCANIFAAPVGNPSSPRLINEGFFIPKTSPVSVRAGYEGDFVGDARLEQYNESSGRVDDYTQDSNCGVLTLNVLDRIDVYSLFGSSRTNADWRFTTDVTHRAEVETLYDFIWGVGARGILWGNEAMCLGLGGRYEQSHYDSLWMTIDGDVQLADGAYLHWREWQIDLDFSYKIDIFTPYIGLKYSNARTKISGDVPISNNGSEINQFENRNPVGIFIGCSLSSGKYFMLNVEGRLIDESAVTISGDLRF